MYEVTKSVIQAGGFKLADIQHKIKKLWLLGDLTEEQADQLQTMAMQMVNVDAERPALLQMIQNLSIKLDALTARVDEITGGADVPEAPVGYPAWEPWDGISNQYQPDAIVSHNGNPWLSVYPGQNVWEPGTVDDRFWVNYTPEV